MAKIKAKKRDSGSRGVKAALRRWILEQVKPAHVLDLFAGTGGMYRAVWKEADSYVGCDLRWRPDERLAYVCDNRRLLRCLNLERFTVFDLDAYGSPWAQVRILAARRVLGPGECAGIVVTDGASMYARFGNVERNFAALAGLKGGEVHGMHREWGGLMKKALAEAAKEMAGEVIACRVKRGGKVRFMYYAAAVVRGISR